MLTLQFRSKETGEIVDDLFYVNEFGRVLRTYEAEDDDGTLMEYIIREDDVEAVICDSEGNELGVISVKKEVNLFDVSDTDLGLN